MGGSGGRSRSPRNRGAARGQPKAGDCVRREEKVEEEFGRPISIVDERTLSQQESPLATVETLAEYITSLLEEGAHA